MADGLIGHRVLRKLVERVTTSPPRHQSSLPGSDADLLDKCSFTGGDIT